MSLYKEPQVHLFHISFVVEKKTNLNFIVVNIHAQYHQLHFLPLLPISFLLPWVSVLLSDWLTLFVCQTINLNFKILCCKKHLIFFSCLNIHYFLYFVTHFLTFSFCCIKDHIAYKFYLFNTSWNTFHLKTTLEVWKYYKVNTVTWTVFINWTFRLTNY